MNKRTAAAIIICLILVISAGLALAQRPGQAGPRGNAPRPGMRQGRAGMQPGAAGAFDPAQMQAMMSQRMQRQVGATDEQWKAIWPKLQKVMELSRELSGGGGGPFGGFAGAGRGGFGGPGPMGGGPGGPGGPGGLRGPGRPQPDAAAGPQPNADRELTAVQKATQELQDALDAEAPNPEQVKAGLAALRQAKDKVKQDLAKAQAELKQGLSINHEAALVIMGHLN